MLATLRRVRLGPAGLARAAKADELGQDYLNVRFFGGASSGTIKDAVSQSLDIAPISLVVETKLFVGKYVLRVLQQWPLGSDYFEVFAVYTYNQKLKCAMEEVFCRFP